MSKELLEICAKSTDFALCDALHGAIECKYGHFIRPLDNVPEAQRCVHLIWAASGFIGNAGLMAFLHIDFDKLGLIDAYHVVGMSDQAFLLSRVVSGLGDPLYGDSSPSRIDEMNSRGVSEELVDELESEYFKKDKSLPAKLSEFVRGRLNEFADLSLSTPKVTNAKSNIAYLNSLLYWLEDYSDDHEGRIPSWSELQDHCMHDGLRNSSSDAYTVLAAGIFSKLEATDPVARYNSAIFGSHYVILRDGSIIEI